MVLLRFVFDGSVTLFPALEGSGCGVIDAEDETENKTEKTGLERNNTRI
jgi:hypothetical protein